MLYASLIRSTDLQRRHHYPLFTNERETWGGPRSFIQQAPTRDQICARGREWRGKKLNVDFGARWCWMLPCCGPSLLCDLDQVIQPL